MEHIAEKYGLFIDGEWREASDGGTFDTFCPANGQRLAVCAEATQQDVEDAAEAAWTAWETWKDVSPEERQKLLFLSLIHI